MTETDQAPEAPQEVPAPEEVDPAGAKSHHLLLLDRESWALSHPVNCPPEGGTCPVATRLEEDADLMDKQHGKVEQYPAVFRVQGTETLRFIQQEHTEPEASQGPGTLDPERVYDLLPKKTPTEPTDQPKAQWPTQVPGEEPIEAPTPEDAEDTEEDEPVAAIESPAEDTDVESADTGDEQRS